MSALEFGILALAAWRLAYMLVREDGPFAMFARLRRRAGLTQIIVNGPNGPDVAWSASNTLAEGLQCVWCVSVWTATLLYGSTLLPHAYRIVWVLIYVLAISAAAIAMHQIIERLRGAFE